MSHDTAVIGLGAMGAATVYQLARRGVKVVGFDRFSPPHDQGSSHGHTRITRLAVGEGDAYAPLVARSQAIWRALEAETGVDLFAQCGVLVMGTGDGGAPRHGMADFTQSTIDIARRQGVAHEVLDADALRARFPQFGGLPDRTVAYYEAGGGYLRPERCIATQLTLARRHGADLRTGVTVTGLHSEGGVVTITTSAGTVRARRVVVTAGMWSAPLLGAPFDCLLRVCRQTLYWFRLVPGELPGPVSAVTHGTAAAPTPSTASSTESIASLQPSPAFPPGSPTFILFHGPSEEDACYGFPPLPGEACIKVATEQYALASDPEALDRRVTAEDGERMFRTHLAGRLVGVTPEVVRSAVCAYTVTPDAGFIIDDHPHLPGVTVVSACSGHGFKHSAAIGEALAQRLVDGRSDIDLQAFSLARFG